MNILDAEGSLIYGPKTFAEVTGRTKLWAKPSGADIEREERPCPLCGEADNWTELFRTADTYDDNDGLVPGWSYVRCSVCSMVYQNPAPTAKALAAYYKEGSAPTDWVEYTQQHALELELDRRKFRWALEKCGWPEKMPKKFNSDDLYLLDIGCSTGTLLEVACEMAKQQVSLWGVEPNGAAGKVAIERMEKCQPHYYEILDEWSRVGVHQLVVLFEVLEHVLEPEGLLRRAVRRLKGLSGSTLLLCVPNMNSLAAKVLHEKAPMFGTGHLNMFTPETLRQMLLKVMPDAEVQFFSIISWAKELSNYYNFKGPFDDDRPSLIHFNPQQILDQLLGYKLVAIAKRLGG